MRLYYENILIIPFLIFKQNCEGDHERENLEELLGKAFPGGFCERE